MRNIRRTMIRLLVALLLIVFVIRAGMPDSYAVITGVFLLPRVEEIDEEAFAGVSVKILHLPAGVKTIRSRAFADNDSLSSVTISRTVKQIADDAFDISSKVKFTVYRESWAEQWCAQHQAITVVEELLEASITPELAVVGNTLTLSCSLLEEAGEMEGMRWQWEQREKPDAEWQPCTPGAGKQSFTMKATKAILDREYRCVMTDESGVYHSLPTRVKTYAEMKAITHAWVSGTRVSLAWRECGVTYTLLKAKENGSFQEVPMSAIQKRQCYFDFTGETEELTLEKDTTYHFKLKVTTGRITVETEVVSVTTGNYVTGAQYRALVINDYSFPGVNQLSPKAGKLINNLLHNVSGPLAPEKSGYQVTYLENKMSAGIKAAIDTAFAGADEDDVSLFYVACHGNVTSAGAGAGALWLTDGKDTDDLRLGTLAEWLSAVPGKVIVLLEACGSGAGVYVEESSSNALSALNSQVVNAFQAADQALTTGVKEYVFNAEGEQEPTRTPRTGELRKEKFCVLTAAAYQQESYDYFFDGIIVNGVGLTGAMPADVEGDGDGVVTLNELHRYIQRMGDHYPLGLKSNFYTTQQVQVYPENSGYPLFSR